jgi:two-component system phosphate regulon sensor histidine kinase PhoR
MKLKRFFLRNFLTVLIFLLVIFIIIFIFSLRQLRQIALEDQVKELTDLALALSAGISGFESAEVEPLGKSLLTQARISGTRVTLINPAGKVTFDSEAQVEDMESHRYRPEITAALAGEVYSTVRHSDTLNRDMLYIAVPVRKEGTITGVCRVSRPLNLAVASYVKSRNQIVAVLFLLFLIAGALFFFILRILFRPLEDLSLVMGKALAGREEVSVGPSLTSALRPFANNLEILLDKSREFSETLKSNREVFQTLVDSAEEGWLQVDRDGRIILMNQSLKRMFPEVSTESEFFWQTLRRPELNELVDRARQSRQPVQGQFEKGGRTYSCLVSWLPLRQDLLLRFSDITETRELARRKKEFVANLAHELKTPLTSVSGFLETLEEDKLSPESQNYLIIIKRNTDRLVRLVEDLSRLAELEEKGFELEKRPVDLAEVARVVVEAYQKEARARGLYLRLEAELLPEILADAFQMEQMLINLVDNAIRYTEKGGVIIKIEKSDEGILLSVTDTGMGIAEEHLPRIFERFYVVDKSRSRKTGGTGLGLSIVKHIVIAHQGRIEVKSAPGFGTSFLVWLPAAQTDSQSRQNKL